jgi:hypothetical protein
MSVEKMMSYLEVRFFPNILVPSDLAVIDTAMRSVMFACRHGGCDVDSEKVARIVFRLYRMGLTDPEKLSMLAARLSRKAGQTIS